MSNDDHSTDASPWSALDDTRLVEIVPANGPISGKIVVPGSKSVTNRALILAAMAEGTTRLSAFLRSNDSYWCIDSLRRLGATIDVEDDTAVVTGIGRARPNPTADLFVGSSGTLSRFLIGFLAAGGPGTFRVTGTTQLTARPFAPLLAALRAGGARISDEGQEGCLPITVEGGTFGGGAVSIAGDVSSQFVSGILMAGGQAPAPLDLGIVGHIVQSDYVHMTMDTMRHFGVEVASDAALSAVTVPNSGYKARDLTIEADASTATYFAALAAVTGGKIEMPNLSVGTRQPDIGFLEILEQLGATVTRTASAITVTGSGKLRGGQTFDMRPLSDAALTLAAIAPFADAPITMYGIEHIRHHECDRIRAACQSLAVLGVPVVEMEDGMTIIPAEPRHGEIETYDDHRVAMAFAVLGAAAAGIGLRRPGCVSKTCPTFFDLLTSVGVGTTVKR